ncbi:MAG: glucose-6-phosphate isomerase [Longimicrobiales bacterium]|nr:glucose-6-phosphate isomerase [Longimicrobiales bacterium]
MKSVTLDYANMLSPNLGGRGMDPMELKGGRAEAFREAYEDVESRRQSGEMGFFSLPDARESAKAIQELADGFGQWFENLVVLGIGGSALGTTTLRDSLLGPHWNELDEEARDHYPRLYVLDNVDPRTVSALLDRLDLRRTLFNVVSKSGSTAETMSQYMVVQGRLHEILGEAPTRGHFLFTTDPNSGILRKIADEEGVPALEVPSNVGGRFSVLSAVGLLPAAVVGIDIMEVLDGAKDMAQRCRTSVLGENPAGLLATLLHHAATAQGAPIQVLMPYSDRLRSFAAWFQQLWAESLGKARDREGREVNLGPTPVPALGATDQHSLLQLLMEGPRDKVVLFMGVGGAPDPVKIPAIRQEFSALSYLGGHTLADLLDTERKATMEALRQQGRPNLSLEVDDLTPRALGELFMLFQIATVFAGALYGVDPLDQPGVELSKALTYGLLGREGFPRPQVGIVDHDWRV